MSVLPDLGDFLAAIDNYRYTISLGLLMACFTPLLFPVGWNMITPIWTFTATATFFLAVARIFVVDVWPYLKRNFFQ